MLDLKMKIKETGNSTIITFDKHTWLSKKLEDGYHELSSYVSVTSKGCAYVKTEIRDLEEGVLEIFFNTSSRNYSDGYRERTINGVKQLIKASIGKPEALEDMTTIT